MHQFRSIRRATLGVALTVAALAAVPALASASSTCTYNPAAKTATVVQSQNPANSLTPELKIARSFNRIVFVDLTGGASFHACGNATVFNTDRIEVLAGSRASVHIDEGSGRFAPGFTPEPGGTSAIAIAISNPGSPSRLTVTGTATADNNIRVTGRSAGDVDLDGDGDVDITQTNVDHITVNGGNGDDLVSGRGTAQPGVPGSGSLSTTLPLTVFGGRGADILESGRTGVDELSGGDGSDILNSLDGNVDHVRGGEGFDLATTDSIDRADDVIESRTDSTIGRLRLAPHVLRGRVGKTAHLTMSWTHPRSWRELRKVSVGLYRGAKQVGMINVRPRGERLATSGSVQIMANGSRVTHRGKTVKARLALRLARSLAGNDVHVYVKATDRHGHIQMVPDAGVVRVAK